MTNVKKTFKTIPFDVHIPNLEGDGIAETVTIQVEVHSDPESGEDILTPESMELIEHTKARHMGLISAKDIKALRDRLALSQAEMSELLQTGEKSYTRWESGRARPSRSINVLLCALRDGQIDVNYLRALRDPSAHRQWATREYAKLFFYRFACQPIKGEVRRHLQESLAAWADRWQEGGLWRETAHDILLQGTCGAGTRVRPLSEMHDMWSFGTTCRSSTDTAMFWRCSSNQRTTGKTESIPLIPDEQAAA